MSYDRRDLFSIPATSRVPAFRAAVLIQLEEDFAKADAVIKPKSKRAFAQKKKKADGACLLHLPAAVVWSQEARFVRRHQKDEAARCAAGARRNGCGASAASLSPLSAPRFIGARSGPRGSRGIFTGGSRRAVEGLLKFGLWLICETFNNRILSSHRCLRKLFASLRAKLRKAAEDRRAGIRTP